MSSKVFCKLPHRPANEKNDSDRICAKFSCLNKVAPIFSYPSLSTCVLGAQKNRLIEAVLLSNHNICFG